MVVDRGKTILPDAGGFRLDRYAAPDEARGPYAPLDWPSPAGIMPIANTARERVGAYSPRRVTLSS